MDDNQQNRAGSDGLTPVGQQAGAYDATRDPRTGRPPGPLEAQRLTREHATEQIKENDEGMSSVDQDGLSNEFAEPDRSPVPEWQAPARMTSPKTGEDEKRAVGALMLEGVAREQAEELVKAHGTNWESLKAAARAGDAHSVDQDATRRQKELDEHHHHGIPPYEPPGRA
jgi:hypothetical protein